MSYEFRFSFQSFNASKFLEELGCEEVQSWVRINESRMGETSFLWAIDPYEGTIHLVLEAGDRFHDRHFWGPRIWDQEVLRRLIEEERVRLLTCNKVRSKRTKFDPEKGGEIV